MIEDTLRRLACAVLFITGYICACDETATGLVQVIEGAMSIAVFYLGARVIKPVIDKHHEDEEI